jgi:hypothetical protein
MRARTAAESVFKSAADSARDLQRVHARQRTCTRHADRSDNARDIAAPTPGREQLPEQGRGRYPVKTGGLLTPPLTGAGCERRVAAGTKRRPLRGCCYSSKSLTVWCMRLRERSSRSRRSSFNGTQTTFQDHANHRRSSRPPSRRQPFPDLRVDDQGKERDLPRAKRIVDVRQAAGKTTV